MIATGQNVGDGDTGNPFAYLDGPTSDGQAGLGVCQVLDLSEQCAPSSDDNVTGLGPTEQLTLTFNDLVEFLDITFKSENHFAVDAGELASTETLIINGMSTTFGGALATLMAIGPATTSTFN